MMIFLVVLAVAPSSSSDTPPCSGEDDKELSVNNHLYNMLHQSVLQCLYENQPKVFLLHSKDPVKNTVRIIVRKLREPLAEATIS